MCATHPHTRARARACTHADFPSPSLKAYSHLSTPRAARTVQCTASLVRSESGAIESVLSVTLQTLNKFAKNNELEKIKLYILMGANPDRRVHRLSPPPHPLAWPSAQGLLVPRAVLQPTRRTRLRRGVCWMDCCQVR